MSTRGGVVCAASGVRAISAQYVTLTYFVLCMFVVVIPHMQRGTDVQLHPSGLRPFMMAAEFIILNRQDSIDCWRLKDVGKGCTAGARGD